MVKIYKKKVFDSLKRSQKIIYTIITLLIIVSAVEAGEIDVSVGKVLQGQIKVFYDSTVNNVFKITTEIYNIGSVNYNARVRLDIFNRNLDQTNPIFTGWSNEKPIMCGSRKKFDIYWYRFNSTGNFTARIKAYYANEIVEYDDIEFEIKNAISPEDVFEISSFRTYDQYLKFFLKSDKSVENVIVFPSKYPLGWMFEQTKIEDIEGCSDEKIIIPYQASLFNSTQITMTIITEDGKYYKEEQFKLEKESGVWKYIHLLIEYLKDLI